MKFINFIKNKIKSAAAKIAGVPKEPIKPSFANISILKNSEEICNIKSTSSDISDDICKIIQCFSKWNNYKIIYDYPARGIFIYFTVTKAQDVEQADSNKKSNKEG